MKYYTAFNSSSGEIVSVFNSPEHLVARNTPAGCEVIEGQGAHSKQYVRNGALFDYTAEQAAAKAIRPTRPAKWSNYTMSWEQPLEVLKASQRDGLKAARNAFIVTPLATPFGTFDADLASQDNIKGAIQLSDKLVEAGQSGSVNFILANNERIMLTNEQLNTVGLLLGAKTQAAFNHFGQLSDAILAATTEEEVRAIAWTTPPGFEQ